MNKKLLMLLSVVSVNLLASNLFAMGDGSRGGAAADIVDRLGRTALHIAAEAGDVATVQALMRAGADIADINVRDNDGNTPLIYAITVYDQAEVGSRVMVDALLDLGADPDRYNSDGLTPLLLAAERDSLAAVEALVSAVAVIDRPNNDGTTPLSSAVGNNNLDIVRALLGAGANPSAYNRDGITLLMYAVRVNNPEIVQALVDAGATVNARDIRYRTALDYAREEDVPEIVRVLTVAGAVAGESHHHVVSEIDDDGYVRYTARG